MGRKNVSKERRAQIIEAFATILANHGFTNSTMLAIASQAELSPGLLHHHFRNKKEILRELIITLEKTFNSRFTERLNNNEDPVISYLQGALQLDHRADIRTVKCWVGVFAEAIRDPVLFNDIRRLLKEQTEVIQKISSNKLGEKESCALFAFILGSIIYGTFAPQKTKGFALPSAILFYNALKK